MASGSVTTFTPTKTTKKRKRSPKEYDKAKDSNSEKGAGGHPNQIVWRSRSGHHFISDDSKGNETLTVGHRSGTQIQMRPDGGLHMTTHNGKYEVVFGEDRIVISGAQDVTVKGDASMRVYGDYNTTVHGDYNMTIMGDFNVTSKNHNRLIRGHIHTIAKDESKKLEGSSEGVYGGGYARTSEDAISVVSRKNQGYFGAGEGAHLHKVNESSEGPLTVRNRKGDSVQQNDNGKNAFNVEKDGKKVYMVADAGKFSVKADDNTNIETQKSLKVKAQQDIGMSAQQSLQMESQSGTEITSQQDIHVNAQGNAGLEGSQTHVGRTAGTTHVVGATTHVEGQTALNLNGGGGQAFNGQFSFDFGSLLSQMQMPSIEGAGAQATVSEPPASNWTSRLA